MSTPGRAAREARVKVQPVPLAAKKVEERRYKGCGGGRQQEQAGDIQGCRGEGEQSGEEGGA